jgi:hypothetical protein
MTTVFLTIVILVGKFFVSSAECPPPGQPKVELDLATAVFSGKVISRERVREETSPGEFSERVVIRIAVDRVWKGDMDSDATIYTSEVLSPNGTKSFNAEDFPFKEKERYLVYAFGKPERLRTNQCSRTRKMAEADEDLKELGNGKPPKANN